MRISVYIDGEYVYGQSGLEEESLSEIHKLFLKNPTMVALSELRCIPKIGSTWDGLTFSEIETEDYQSFIDQTGKDYFAIVLDGLVEKVLGYDQVDQEKEIAMMSSNPFFMLEDESSNPITNPMSRNS